MPWKTPTILAAILVASLSVPSTAALFETQAILDQADEFADEPMFDAVGWIRGENAAGDRFFAGTASLIHPEWVLTATHIDNWSGNNQPFAELAFSLSSRVFDEPPNYVSVDQRIAFPGFNPDPGRGHDVLLLHLAEPITDVDPLVRYRGSNEVGMRFYVVGYGDPGVWPNPGAFDGVQRAGENVVDCFGCLVAVDNNYLLADFGPGAFTPSLPMEWAGSDRDSGGVWLANTGSRMELIGVPAFERGGYLTTGASRISDYNPWIDSVVIPEPATITVLLISSLICVGFSRTCS